MSRDFRFKRFNVVQQRSAMKVGTDGVLLGAWCSLPPGEGRILDVGSGTGLISLMVAQRTEGRGGCIDALEPDVDSYEESLFNFGSSEWADRLSVINRKLQDYYPADVLYDLIVTNPPYFADSLLPPCVSRTTARHTTHLSHEELISHSVRLLAPGGIFSVILPHGVAEKFTAMASGAGLHVCRRTHVTPKPGVDPKRSLLEFGFLVPTKPVQAGGLVIEQDGRHSYSREYRELTSAFYLDF